MASRLKNSLLGATMLILGIAPALAQAPKDPPVYDTGRPEKIVYIKPFVATGISSLFQNYAEAVAGVSDIQMAPGVIIRTGLDLGFLLRNSLAIGTGLSFDINNSKYALSIVDNNTGSINSIYVTNHFRCLTVPLYLSWRFNLGRRMRWSVDPGMYMSLGMGGKMKGSGYTSGINSIGQPVITHLDFETKYFEDTKAIINGVKAFDYGPRLATGLIYRDHYSLNIVLQVSAANLAINHNVLDVKYRNVTLAFEIGYSF